MDNFEIRVDDSLYTLPDNPWKSVTEWFEYNFAVKWYAVQVYKKSALAGFMHVFRYPDAENKWYFCDVHTMPEYQRKGVATMMYEKALELVSCYDRANTVIASVDPGNGASVALHKKHGFIRTGTKPDFPEMTFAPGEVLFEYCFAFVIPYKQNENDLRIWAGNEHIGNAVKKAGAPGAGCTYEFFSNEWRERFENGILHITEVPV